MSQSDLKGTLSTKHCHCQPNIKIAMINNSAMQCFFLLDSSIIDTFVYCLFFSFNTGNSVTDMVTDCSDKRITMDPSMYDNI